MRSCAPSCLRTVLQRRLHLHVVLLLALLLVLLVLLVLLRGVLEHLGHGLPHSLADRRRAEGGLDGPTLAARCGLGRPRGVGRRPVVGWRRPRHGSDVQGEGVLEEVVLAGQVLERR